MKTQFRIINKGKGILKISPLNLDKVEQPISELAALKAYVDTQDTAVLNAANIATDTKLTPITTAIDILESSVVNMTTDITNLNTEIDTLNTDVDAIDGRVLDLEYPDAVLKSGNISFTNLSVAIGSSVFAWRLNRIEYLNPSAYNIILDAATVDYIRYDILVGKANGTYGTKKGIEGATSADIPTPDVDALLLATFAIIGSEIVEVIEEPAYDYQALEDRVTVLENKVEPVDIKTGLLGQAYVVWSGTGLKYYVNYPAYVIGSTTYPKGTAEVILDPTTNILVGEQRYDLITLIATGVSKVTGTSSLDPVLPTINLDIEIVLTNILLNFGDVVPVGAVRKQVYDENVEWVVTKAGAVAINPNYTTFKFKGTKSLQVTNFGSGSEQIIFTSPIVETFLDYDTLTFRIYLPSNVNSTLDFNMHFKNGNIIITENVNLVNNKYDFLENKKDIWQLINIPLSNFQMYNINFTAFVIDRYAKDRSFLLDDIAFVKKESTAFVVTTPATQRAIKSIVTDDGIYNAPTPDALVKFHSASNSLKIKALNDEITFTILTIYIHDFISLINQQQFNIPDGFTITSVFLNRTFLMQSEYTFANNILTIIETIETGTIISTR